MPEEVLIITIVGIVFGSIVSIVKATLNYFHARRGPAQPAGSSLTTSELQRLMQAAVEEATRPLAAKIDHLEEQLAVRSDPAALPAASAGGERGERLLS